MGAAIDRFAAAEAVRDTLDNFLEHHPELEHCSVEVAEHTDVLGEGGFFGITIDGFALEIRVTEPGDGK